MLLFPNRPWWCPVQPPDRPNIGRWIGRLFWIVAAVAILPAQDAIIAKQQHAVATLLNHGESTAAFAKSNEFLLAYPLLPAGYLFRAAAEAQLQRWPEARRDCDRALQIWPGARFTTALVLAGGPDDDDRHRALAWAKAAVENPTSPFGTTMPVVLLARLIPAPQFIAFLQRSTLDLEQRFQTLDTYLAWQVSRDELPGSGGDFWLGLEPDSADDPLDDATRTAAVATTLHLADQALGDQWPLDILHMDWLVHTGELEAARSLGLVHLKRHPVAELRRATQDVTRRLARRELADGHPDAALATLGPADDNAPDSPATAVLRARVLAALGRDREALQVLLDTSLRQGNGAGPKPSPLQVALKEDEDAVDHDLLFWQGMMAYDAGDYATAANAMSASDQPQKWINPFGWYVLAMSQEKLHRAEQARQSWNKLLELSRSPPDVMFEPYALSGLARGGTPSPVAARETYTVEGRLTAVQCRQGRPIGVTLTWWSSESPIRLADTTAATALPGCGLVSDAIWYAAQVKPDPAGMPHWVGRAVSLHPQRLPSFAMRTPAADAPTSAKPLPRR